MKRTIQQLLTLLLICAIVVTACGSQPTPTPATGETPSGGTIRGEAAVETIEILILESFPVQVNVVARGNLPDGCTEIDGIRQERTDQAFQVSITTARPADAMCTEALEPFEETISLEVYGLPAGTYTVDVNGITDSFELSVDNVPQVEPDPPAELYGGVLATFEVAGEQFKVWVTNADTVQQLLDLAAGNSLATIPNGRILSGPGAADHNLPWSWHLDPEEIEMAEMTTEVCDGTPSYVEEHLDEFVETVGRYCPWSARLVSVDVLPGSEPEKETSQVEPPPAKLAIAGQEQVSGIGTYCWTEPAGEGEVTGLCADMIGVPTAEEPLVASSPFTASFHLAPEETPNQLILEVMPVTTEDEMEKWPTGGRGWPYVPGERYTLTLAREPSLELSLEPGLYVLNLQGWWDAWGDASYGFLVEVEVPAPRLVVDEVEIVDAEADGPGHMEYNDRLGEEILARMEGLRTRAAELRLERNNTALAPFGYRIEVRFDAESNQELYDLFREGRAKPILTGLSYLWPVSVNTSGSDFMLVAEKAPAATLYQVQADGVELWDDAADSNWLPPGYVGDDLARITYTDFPTLTYQVELGSRVVYSGTAVAMGAYMPLRSFTTWGNHWMLEVDDQLIMDGQDLGETKGYDAAFGFTLIGGQPFYFFELQGEVHISYGGRTLPNVYDQVFHNQCCEAAMHNPLILGDVVLFHALWNGAWYFIEAGVYDGEMAGTYRYTAPEGWSFRYPMHWDLLDEELGFVQDPATGKSVTFASQPTSQEELAGWLESEIARKLAATEAENTLAEPLSSTQEGDLSVYRYAILSTMDGSDTLLRTTVFFDGQRHYEFYAAIPPVAEEEYEAIVTSFRPAGRR